VRALFIVLSIKQTESLKTDLRLRGTDATMTSRKRKGCYDSGRKYRSEWEIWLFCRCRKLL